MGDRECFGSLAVILGIISVIGFTAINAGPKLGRAFYGSRENTSSIPRDDENSTSLKYNSTPRYSDSQSSR